MDFHLDSVHGTAWNTMNGEPRSLIQFSLLSLRITEFYRVFLPSLSDGLPGFSFPFLLVRFALLVCFSFFFFFVVFVSALVCALVVGLSKLGRFSFVFLSCDWPGRFPATSSRPNWQRRTTFYRFFLPSFSILNVSLFILIGKMTHPRLLGFYRVFQLVDLETSKLIHFNVVVKDVVVSKKKPKQKTNENHIRDERQ